MVTLAFVPGTDWDHFDNGTIVVHRRHKKVFLVGGGFTWFPRGEAGIKQQQSVQVVTFAPFISYSRSVVEPDDDTRPFNLLRGRITARPGATRRLVSSKAGSNAFQRLNGTIVVRRESAAYGTLAGFGYWPTTGGDPIESYFTNITATTDTGGPGTAWKRISTVFVPPRAARYVAIGADLSVSSGDLTTMRPHYIKYAQVEKIPVGGDVSSYSAPREVRTSIRPERLNWDENPAFAVNTTRWTGLTRTASTISPSGWHGQVSTTAVAGNQVTWTHTIPIVYANAEYVISFLVWSSRTVGFTLSVAGGTVLERRVPTETGQVPQRVWLRIQTDAAATAPVLTGVFTGRGAISDCAVSAAMVEQDSQFDVEYFDGSTYGSDSIWENGGTAGQSRSYYYKNRLERLAALKRLLQNNVPYGLPIAEPRMGLLPADIAPVGTSNLIYGSGVYGGGIYGGA